jgi:PadR family transcriptional regulator PadR
VFILEANEWISQVRRGIIEFCVLSLMNQQDRYGYDLVITLGKWEPLAITEGTLYPLLRRLQKEKLIESYWNESESGPPRKYYHLTTQGQESLEVMTVGWKQLSNSINQLQKEGEVNL